MSKGNIQTHYKQELKEKILVYATEQFHTHGVKMVKMDDIAGSFSISKRTLYEIYPTKEDLLLECLRREEEECKLCLEDLKSNHSYDVLDILIEDYQHRMQQLSKINPVFFTELFKYKRVCEYLEEEDKARIELHRQFSERGIAEGLFRSNVYPEIVVNMVTVSMRNAMQSQMYKDFDFKEIFNNIILTIIRGVCTPKGIEKIDRLLQL